MGIQEKGGLWVFKKREGYGYLRKGRAMGIQEKGGLWVFKKRKGYGYSRKGRAMGIQEKPEKFQQPRPILSELCKKYY